MEARHPNITILGLEFRWDLEQGGFTVGGFPSVMFFRDSSRKVAQRFFTTGAASGGSCSGTARVSNSRVPRTSTTRTAWCATMARPDSDTTVLPAGTS